jgi:DNA-binding ferritin-like protein (Dps family)
MSENFLTKMIGDKRQWREYKARVRSLPPAYKEAVDAIERYVMRFGPTDADSAASLLNDIADIFEQAAADSSPIRQIVGQDPVAFVDALIRNYTAGGWVAKEQQRLISAIDDAAGDAGASPR